MNMHANRSFPVCLISFLLSFVTVCGHAQQLASNAPKDTTFSAADLSEFEREIAPSIAEAKKTYPAARERYLAGLPANHSFFVTVRLTDKNGKMEQVFVYVMAIDVKKKAITGRISSDLQIIRDYKSGQVIAMTESTVLDWTISKPDGTEDGNYIGKYMDQKAAEVAKKTKN